MYNNESFFQNYISECLQAMLELKSGKLQYKKFDTLRLFIY